MKIRDKDDKAEMAAVFFEQCVQSSPDKQIRNDICLLGLITTSMPVRLTERGWTDFVNIQRHIMSVEKRDKAYPTHKIELMPSVKDSGSRNSGEHLITGRYSRP